MTQPSTLMVRQRPMTARISSMVFALAIVAVGYTSFSAGSVGPDRNPISAPVEATGRAGNLPLPDGASVPLALVADRDDGEHTTGGPLPIGVRIERIGLDSQLISLGLTENGGLQVPAGEFYDLAGWFSLGPVPGEPGAAVIAGHLDSDTAPSVFYRLGDVSPGDIVEIERADRSIVRFAVDHVGQYSKGDFPTVAVYGPTSDPELRLITCGGQFDRGSGGYDDNVVVFASRV